MRKPWLLPALPALLLAALLAACQEDDLAGTSTETVSGKTTGIIYLADGKPARRARVRVLPVNYQPLSDSARSEIFRTTTDDKGRYLIDSLASGEYNILSELDGEAAYQDSVFLSGTARTLSSDTLEEPGTISGMVVLQPGDPLASATVQVLGTLAYANVEDDGSFQLPPLAPGLYRAAVDADLPSYTTRYFNLRVQSGRAETLADTLSPRFTGIPQVAGLAAEFDTLAQAVMLRWTPTRYANFKEYLVLRAPRGSIQGRTIIAAVRDTSYVDYPSIANDPFSPFPFNPGAWEYSVVIRDKFEDVGRAFGGVEVETPPASTAATTLSVRLVNAPGGAASIGDTVLLIAEWQGTGRDLDLLRWFPAGSPSPVRSVSGLPLRGRDTLIFIAPRAASRHGFRVEIADEAGSEWGAETAVEVKLDPPWVQMAATATGSTGEPLSLHAEVRDGLGRIVSVEWDIGRTGNWSSGLANDTVITLPLAPMEAYPCIVRVTDDDGLIDLDTTYVRVSPWRGGTAMPAGTRGPSVVASGGRLYLFGPQTPHATSEVHEYDPAARVWRARAGMPRIRRNFALVEAGGYIYVLGGTDGAGLRLNKADRYHPETDTWAVLPDMPTFRSEHAAVSLGGKLHVFGGNAYGDASTSLCCLDRMKAVDVFDPATGTWDSFDTPIPFEGRMRAVVQSGKIHVISLDRERTGKFAIFDPAANAWTNLAHIPFLQAPWFGNPHRMVDFAVHAVSGKIVLAGGAWRRVSSGNTITYDWFAYYSNLFYVFDPATGSWRSSWSFATGRQWPSLASIGDDLYLLGGDAGTEPLTDMEIYPAFR